MIRKDWADKGLSVGFVPTMVYTINKHNKREHFILDIQVWVTLEFEIFLKQVKMAQSMCDKVVVSIFVNPAQFAPHEDLNKYPRTLESDLLTLQECSKHNECKSVDVLFVPSVSEMYPNGITLHTNEQQGTFVQVLGKSHQMYY